MQNSQTHADPDTNKGTQTFEIKIIKEKEAVHFRIVSHVRGLREGVWERLEEKRETKVMEVFFKLKTLLKKM